MLQSALLLAVLPVLPMAAPTFSKESQRWGRTEGRKQRQRLQRHLAGEVRHSKAEAAARESLELALHEELTRLRHRLLRSQRRVWSAASPEELQLQVVLSRWPQGSAFLQAAEATSLTSIGMVLTGVQNLYNTFKEDWSELQDSLEQLRKELASQSLQMVVNLEIVLKQAAVLLGLLQGLPNFASCLREALSDRRESRDVLVRASTFAGESFDAEGLLGIKLKSLLAETRDMRKIVEDSELSQETTLDWCLGIRGAWVINGPDPCELLVRSFDSLEGWLSEWLESGRPQEVFRELQIRQFATAPNISRIEELSQLLHRTAELCSESAVRNLTPDPELLATLQAVAHLDEKEVEKEQDLLAEAVATQFGPSEGMHAVDAEVELARPGLLGLVRRAISAQWVFEMGLLAVASWGDRLKRRGNGLQNRLALVKSSLEDLHSQLRGLASFRRLAFEEIHSAGWWGRSGSGSSKEHTAQIAARLVQFLAHIQPGGAGSLLDVGCGWGEWVPEALEAGRSSGELPRSFRYLGLDIAYQPIEHLRRKHRDTDLRFEVADGVEDALPQGYAVAMVRHVFQHLNLRDAWRLLSNLWKAKPAFVVLSSWPDSQNEDLESFGGSSAFAAMEPASLKNFKSYDLQKPPFSLPEPLDSWPEVHQNARMLAFPGEVLRRFE
ncbi:unnamed protein product [Symbiodinium sp. CCMP2456]|nr:unnamed protein product [Symbiodinium sp. CCMP2456]